ncbi:MAG: TRAP transporter small permease [Clostridiales Family XIII bacterium]|jgi:TRAP-type C4-dicarboxylate transport system permease small subunit|nr:TRAP transporter small permease [Clostridiales Family XIII bacterium]
MGFLKKLDKHLEEYLCALLMGIMCLVTGWQIFCRTFGFGVSWQEELARYIFIWLIYLGCSYAVRERKHIKVDATILLFKTKGRFVLSIISNVCFFVFCMFIIYGGSLMLQTAVNKQQLSTAMGLPMWIAQSSYVIGFILMAIRLVQDVVKQVGEHRRGEDVVE